MGFDSSCCCVITPRKPDVASPHVDVRLRFPRVPAACKRYEASVKHLPRAFVLGALCVASLFQSVGGALVFQRTAHSLQLNA